MGIKRREFFKLAGAATATLVPAMAAAGEESHEADYDNMRCVLVDAAVCIGCRKCELACNRQNGLSDKPLAAYEDKTVFSIHRRPSSDAYTVINSFANPKGIENKSYLKVQCMHCNDPACVSACIVGALRKTPEGPVTYDAWRCIGCRYCMVACPFQIPAYEYNNPLNPRVKKCTFCAERLREGKRPACVEICPAEALIYGTRRELLELAHLKIMQNPGLYRDYVYGESEVGGTGWLYLASTDFSHTELPPLPGDAIPHRTETIQHGIFKSFIPPLALYGLLGLVMHSLRRDDQQEAEP